jgi:UPF0271 protein
LAVATEAFADRRYRADGSLQPRNEAGAVIEEAATATAQALGIVRESAVIASHGESVTLQADTLCLHGDGAHALQLARDVRVALELDGVRIAAPGAA